MHKRLVLDEIETYRNHKLDFDSMRDLESFMGTEPNAEELINYLIVESGVDRDEQLLFIEDVLDSYIEELKSNIRLNQNELFMVFDRMVHYASTGNEFYSNLLRNSLDFKDVIRKLPFRIGDIMPMLNKLMQSRNKSNTIYALELFIVSQQLKPNSADPELLNEIKKEIHHPDWDIKSKAILSLKNCGQQSENLQISFVDKLRLSFMAKRFLN